MLGSDDVLRGRGCRCSGPIYARGRSGTADLCGCRCRGCGWRWRGSARERRRWTATLGLGVRDQQTWPRPCVVPCSRCPVGSLAPPGNGPCTCPTAGRGPTRSPWRSLGCAASRTRPDRTSIPRLGLLAGRRLLGLPSRRRQDHPAAQPPAGRPHQPHPAARRPPPPPPAGRDTLPASGNSDRIRASVDPGSAVIPCSPWRWWATGPLPERSHAQVSATVWRIGRHVSPAPCARGDLASHPTIAMRTELNLG
jgi:hypothetical protein